VIDDSSLSLQLCQLHGWLEIEISTLTRQELSLTTFGEFVKQHSDISLSEPRRGLERCAVRKIRDFLEANLSRNAALDDLAELSGLSPYHLVRVFPPGSRLVAYAYFERVTQH